MLLFPVIVRAGHLPDQIQCLHEGKDIRKSPLAENGDYSALPGIQIRFGGTGFDFHPFLPNRHVERFQLGEDIVTGQHSGRRLLFARSPVENGEDLDVIRVCTNVPCRGLRNCKFHYRSVTLLVSKRIVCSTLQPERDVEQGNTQILGTESEIERVLCIGMLLMDFQHRLRHGFASRGIDIYQRTGNLQRCGDGLHPGDRIPCRCFVCFCPVVVAGGIGIELRICKDERVRDIRKVADRRRIDLMDVLSRADDVDVFLPGHDQHREFDEKILLFTAGLFIWTATLGEP